MRTCSLRWVHPTYLPCLQQGHLYKYTRLERMSSGIESLNLKREPMVKGLQKINLKSTKGRSLERVLFNSFSRSGVRFDPKYGNEKCNLSLGTL